MQFLNTSRVHRRARLGALAALATLAAAGGAGTSAAWATQPAAQGKPSSAAAAEGKFEAKTFNLNRAKCNHSGVVVRPVVPDKMAVGETVTLRLHLSGVSAFDGASVEVRDLATNTAVASARLARGEQRTLELPYVGRADGMQFIDVITTQNGRSTVQTVPIRVGSGAMKLKPFGQRSVGHDGEAVVSMPAATPGSATR